MQQMEFFEIPSPCIGVCQSGDRGFCKGCFRSRDERVYWHQVNDEVKRKIIKACAMRKKRKLAQKPLSKTASDKQIELAFQEFR
ncbi:MAG: DUF1289 domain-containing protein [Alteromonadaceae bacterium]|nr:DUF1289 domain-containing protein [Alteromonadaceae bacterium]